jgi:hypothetical protein
VVREEQREKWKMARRANRALGRPSSVYEQRKPR